MGKINLNPRLVKSGRCYDVVELARLYDVHPHTVRSWRKAVLSYAGGGTVMALDVDGDGVADLSIQISGDVSSSSGNLFTGVGDTDGGWIL